MLSLLLCHCYQITSFFCKSPSSTSSHPPPHSPSSISNPKHTKMAPATFFFYLQQNMAPSLSLSTVSVSLSLCVSLG
ncbi:hypothetical protein HanRHA438_Chr04g0164901 [Helianthus annuus]|uniref:Uncharacterized protein n=1 Tax=Helianthus annuus TaxID=4232 RepID=A0A251UWV2_HELAN|nr:hypothetical protein HanXRQr2_Chr04g0154761 [Helianthus annuus]KAJ0580263.1 hypothetical protein HanHA300_Chr04g0127251 [Helianthus annuus]KAJ0587740.1 hypothetical protein HanIR_Chr04g0166671 [Helianthus annuus]KAJ0596208.1 hypothetical protein HanHA89_Chr04g0140181 [Helianthus annuus]KAJ0756863.1 hypothetical protein HanLR1_Chr04g0131961 [Helianthus annuus]